MARRRFYIESLDRRRVRLGKADSDHARRSLRLGVGAVVELFDGQGGCAEGRITALGAAMEVELTRRWAEAPVRPVVELATAVPKGARVEVMVEKLTELGVARWWPVRTSRSVGELRAGRLGRLERLVVAAAKQCGRSHLMTIAPPGPLARLVEQADHDQRRLADCAGPGPAESGPVQNLHRSDQARPGVSTMDRSPTAGRWLILVGPEGGWTAEERQMCLSAGFVPWRLGPHVMRVETAAMAAAVMAMQQAKELWS